MFQKTLGLNDFYFGDDEFSYPMGHISFVGKLDAHCPLCRRTTALCQA